MNVATIDDALLLALESLDEDWKVVDFQFSDDFTLKIKLDGEQWDGAINYKIANFVLHIQRDVLAICNEIAGTKLSLKTKHSILEPFIVEVKVEAGCTDLLVELGKLLEKVIPHMEKKHVAPTIVALAAIGCIGYLGSGYLERTQEIARMESDERKQKMFADTTNRALAIVEKNQDHMQYIVRQMEHDDTITLRDRALSKKDATLAFRPPAEEDSDKPVADTHYVDERYRVTTVGIEKQQVELQIDGIRPFKASTKLLAEIEKKRLYDMLATADIANVVPAVDLQVVIEITEGKISAAGVVGLGAKRPAAVSLAKALLDSEAKSVKRAQAAGKEVQAKLFE